MPTIASVGTALADFHYLQNDVLESVLLHHQSSGADPAAIRRIFLNAQVRHRYLVRSIEEIQRLGSFADRNTIFRDEGLRLAIRAVERCLAQLDLQPSRVDRLIFVSTTGFCVPSLDVYLMQKLGMHPTVKRTPIFGWGCNGGVAGLRTSLEATKADPGERVMLVNLELCSLAYQATDFSPKALVASAIFNDGATAVLVEGDHVPSGSRLRVLPLPPTFGGYPDSVVEGRRANAPKMIGSASRFFPDTLDLMGWEQRDSGLQVILSPRIPEIIAEEAAGFVAEILEKHRVRWEDVSVLISHAGGARVMEALQSSLHLDDEKLAVSWETLREFGNISSCSVLIALRETLRIEYPVGSYGLLLSFGPGFSAEGLLIQW